MALLVNKFSVAPESYSYHMNFIKFTLEIKIQRDNIVNL